MTNRAEIRAKVYQEMVVNSDSTTYNTTRVNNMIDEVSEEFLQKRLFNELTNSDVVGTDLNFNNAKIGKVILSTIPTTAAIAVGDTEISMDTSTLDSTGTVLIGDDVISYTSKTATEIEGVTGILVAHDSGSTVQPLIVLPSDFYKPINVYSIISGRKYFVDYLDEPNRQLNRYYEIIREGNNKYLKTYGVLTGTYYIEYAKEYTYFTDDSTDGVIPEPIALNCIPFIVGGRLIKDPDLRVHLLSEGYGKAALAYTRYATQTSKQKTITRTRPSFSSLKG